MRQIAKKCEEEKFVFSKIIDCKRLIGRKAELIFRELEAAVKICKRRFPSVLLLDDVDGLFTKQNAENEQNYAEGNYLNG